MSPNGFGISEVSEGILERSGRIPRAHFAYSVLSDLNLDSLLNIYKRGVKAPQRGPFGAAGRDRRERVSLKIVTLLKESF